MGWRRYTQVNRTGAQKFRRGGPDGKNENKIGQSVLLLHSAGWRSLSNLISSFFSATRPYPSQAPRDGGVSTPPAPRAATFWAPAILHVIYKDLAVRGGEGVGIFFIPTEGNFSANGLKYYKIFPVI